MCKTTRNSEFESSATVIQLFFAAAAATRPFKVVWLKYQERGPAQVQHNPQNAGKPGEAYSNIFSKGKHQVCPRCYSNVKGGQAKKRFGNG
jgi:hypothetical protein